MAKDPAFLFYPGDWLGGTMGMTFEQKGAYFELLIFQFNNGKFTLSQAKQVLSICSPSVQDIVLQKFSKDGESFFSQRLQAEIEKRKSFSESRRNNAKGIKNQELPIKKEKAYARHMEDENRNEDESIIEVLITPTFDDFWDKYNKKQDRPKCETKWKKITQVGREKIMQHLELYIPSTPDVKYRKNPLTYLNNESWNNDIITGGTKQGSGITPQGSLERLNAYTNG